MSIISIAGTLILNGDIITPGQVEVTGSGKLIPVARDLMDSIYSCPTKDFQYQNGKSPTITSTAKGDNVIHIWSGGVVDGVGQGFPPNAGPGANSSLLDSAFDPSDIYGANHAGIGTVTNIPGTIELLKEDYTVHTINIAMGGINLTYTPISDNIAVNVIHGPSQVPGVDFILQGSFLRWSGYLLDTIIGVGDVVRVIYLADTSRYFPSPKRTYGSYEAPTSIGSGSGEAAGGSGLKLVARSGQINLNGTINVSGENGLSARSGGGSGGSFWVSAYNLTGSGTLMADGGDASYAYAGGGGGGYITLDYENENTFQGTLSAAGRKGATHGITSIEKIEPFFIEKFTGTVLNPKWWEIVEDPVSLNNVVIMDTTTGDTRNPRLESLFQVSGTNIQVDCDFIPSGMEPSYHTSYFQLFIDDRNWVQVARKHNNFFGMYTVDGFLYQTAMPYDFTNTTFRILKSDSTFTFQFVDSSAGPFTILTETIPDFTNAHFSIALGTQKDDADASNFISDYYKLTNVDEAYGYITLSDVPIDASNVTLNVIGGSPQIYGIDYTVSGQQLYWNPMNLYLQEDDEITVEYAADTTFNDLNISWDNFRVFSGILHNTETTQPVLYVDPIYGSDMSAGTILNPLKNLFVATAWAKRGSTVVLYTGVHNATEIDHKNLTILGANGSTAIISSALVQDTTGSNWENSCLTFHDCKGLVRNVHLTQSVNGVYAEDTWDLEISNCQIYDTTTGIRFSEYSKDSRVIGNTIYDSVFGVNYERQNYNPYIYSNVIHDTSSCVFLADGSNFTVSSNTFDTAAAGLVIDETSTGSVASNNMTNMTKGIFVLKDTTMGIFNNNFYGTATPVSGTGTITDYTNNISVNPNYANQFVRDYHLLPFSADRSAGTGRFDLFMMDRDGADRTNDPGYDIGAYQYTNATHTTGSYFVDTSGSDYRNTGNYNSPYRTLDKAMSLADSSVFMGTGHFDSFFLKLKGQNIYFVDADASVQTFTLDSNYSNINLGSVLYVSPSGSDSTVMGGDGTNSGGNGTLQKPFRTIARALEVSSAGTCIVTLSGEYPLFNGSDGRIIVPLGDQTGIPDGRVYLEDLFYTPLEDFPGHVLEESSWNLIVE